MAIEFQYLSLLKKIIDRKVQVGRKIQLLCLSYPDILVPEAKLEEMLTKGLLNTLPKRSDADKIWAWHNLSGCREPIYETIALLQAMGAVTEIIDIAASRGGERIVDLNEPLPGDLNARFDVVVDTGTCEHCFNVGQAFANACAAVAVGGHLIHAAPLNRYNHGFWNFSPTVYPDFLLDNGFKIEIMTGMTSDLRLGFSAFEVKPFTKFDPPKEAVMFVVAERQAAQALKWPVQRKYRKTTS
jgi:hypothetical protein